VEAGAPILDAIAASGRVILRRHACALRGLPRLGLPQPIQLDQQVIDLVGEVTGDGLQEVLRARVDAEGETRRSAALADLHQEVVLALTQLEHGRLVTQSAGSADIVGQQLLPIEPDGDGVIAPHEDGELLSPRGGDDAVEIDSDIVVVLEDVQRVIVPIAEPGARYPAQRAAALALVRRGEVDGLLRRVLGGEALAVGVVEGPHVVPGAQLRPRGHSRQRRLVRSAGGVLLDVRGRGRMGGSQHHG